MYTPSEFSVTEKNEYRSALRRPTAELTSGAGRLATNCAHSSFALCNLGDVDMRRVKDRLATWVVALRAAENDILLMDRLAIQ